MELSGLLYVVFAVGTFHAVVAGIYWYATASGRRAVPRVRALVRRTLAASVGLVVAYLTGALLAFQLLPVDVGYPIFVAAWAGYGIVLACLFGLSGRHSERLRAEIAGQQPT